MKNVTKIVSYVLGLALIGSAAAQQPASSGTKQGPAKTQPAIQSALAGDADAGQKKFEANCNRCHNAPQALSPRIVGTVARHMRVRASLSAEDERDILRFLAP